MSNTNNNQALVELPNLSDIVRRNTGAVPQQVQKPQITITEPIAKEVARSEVTHPTAKAPPKESAQGLIRQIVGSVLGALYLHL